MAYPQDDRSGSITGRADGQVERDDAASAAIERDIDRTRSRMDETVDTLADRLRPSNIVSDLLDWFASDEGVRTDDPQRKKVKRVARRAGRGAWDAVRENPIPSALIAGGIAWIMLKGDDDDDGASPRDVDAAGYGSSEYRRQYPGLYGDAYAREGESEGMTGRLRHYAHEAAEGARHAAGWVSDKASRAAGAAGETAHSVGDSARGMGERTGDLASSAGDAIGDAASSSWEAMRNQASAMGRRTRRISHAASDRTRAGYTYSRERFESGLNEHPLAMGIAALSAGVLAGLVVPRTRREDRMFGEYSHEVKHRVGDVAGEAMHRARMTAQQEGITPDTLAAQAKDLARRARESAERIAGAAGSKVREAVDEVREQSKFEVRELRHEASDRGLSPSSLKEKVAHVAAEASRGASEEATHAASEAKQQHGAQ